MNKLKLKRYPTISVLIATFNSHNTIEMCLNSVRSQEYPQKKIEIILADGGSKDDTIIIGKKFGDYLGCRAEILGGAILLLIGLKAIL